MPTDGVALILKKISEVAPEFSADKLPMIEREIRRAFGGTRVWIGKAPKQTKTALLGDAMARGLSVPQAAADVGVGERHARRLLAQRCKK
ncbi:MAG: hypothetical protein ACK51V_02890 [bacterium]|jgi:hypothetical protein|nr:hypothetical protein [Betaproteobacteria bacterium]